MSEQGLVSAVDTHAQRRGAGAAALPAWLNSHRAHVVAGTVAVLYVLVFARGLAWQWQSILTGAPAARQDAVRMPPSNASSSRAGAQEAPAAAPRAKEPLPPTDEPPPRNTTDRYGVFYDAQGVAVMGIDADPAGVYNVPPGRQVRIGGPAGALFDVQVGGKITPATAVRQQP
jgi:hypothetical protein